MIGNDIVDLKCAQIESNWQRPGFFEKIFTSKEVNFIQDSSNPESIVWLLWSIKESVYKIVSKMEGRRFFAPKKIACEALSLEFLQKSTSIASYKMHSFIISSTLTDDFIHSIARVEPIHNDVYSNLFYAEKQKQSIELRRQSIAAYSSIIKIEPMELSIKKDKTGAPYFLYRNMPQAADLSFSHHGNYAAYAITTPSNYH